MEISSAVAASGDKGLQAKFNLAMEVIVRTLSLYGFEEVAFSFNGGKDSTVLLHLLRAGYAAALQSQAASFTCGEDARPTTHNRIRTIYFESPHAFSEIDSFTRDTARTYNLDLEEVRLDFKSGLVELQKKRPIKAVFLGTRVGDPNAVGQEQFSPSSRGWPAFMRVNPILDWSYRDVWSFLLVCKVPYCSLYDQGYTSIGSIHDTLPNEALLISNLIPEEDPSLSTDKRTTCSHDKKYQPAYLLRDPQLERAGRLLKNLSLRKNSTECLTENGAISG